MCSSPYPTRLPEVNVLPLEARRLAAPAARGGRARFDLAAVGRSEPDQPIDQPGQSSHRDERGLGHYQGHTRVPCVYAQAVGCRPVGCRDVPSLEVSAVVRWVDDCDVGVLFELTAGQLQSLSRFLETPG